MVEVEKEATGEKITQLLTAPKGLYAVLQNTASNNYEAYPVVLFALFDDGTFDEIVLIDGHFEEKDLIVGCKGCFTEKQIKNFEHVLIF